MIISKGKINRCFDKFNNEILVGDFIDVQTDPMPRKVYKKEGGELYFNPYETKKRYQHILKLI
jgi:hypothetical protein